MTRVVFLNALPLNAIADEKFYIFVKKTNLQDIANSLTIQNAEKIHYIRHSATLRLLRKYFPSLSDKPSDDLYKYNKGDILVIVTLKTPVRGAEQKEVSESDVEIYEVSILYNI